MHSGNEKPSFGESAPHVLRLEMDEPPQTSKEIPGEGPIDRALRAIKDINAEMNERPPQKQNTFVNVLGTSVEQIVRHPSERGRAIQQIESFLNSIKDPEKLTACKRAVEARQPRLEYHQRLAEWEMFLADHLYSNPQRFSGPSGQRRLDALDKIFTNSKLDIAGRPFDLSGIKGLAGAVALIGSKRYVPFFPDPLLDVLLKIDAWGYREDADHYIVAQVKARRNLAPSTPIIDTPQKFFERRDVRDNFSDVHISRLADDALVLELTAEALNKNYRGRYTPLLIVMPSFNPQETHPDFDTQTGLPNRTAIDTISWPREV